MQSGFDGTDLERAELHQRTCIPILHHGPSCEPSDKIGTVAFFDLRDSLQFSDFFIRELYRQLAIASWTIHSAERFTTVTHSIQENISADRVYNVDTFPLPSYTDATRWEANECHGPQEETCQSETA